MTLQESAVLILCGVKATAEIPYNISCRGYTTQLYCFNWRVGKTLWLCWNDCQTHRLLCTEWYPAQHFTGQKCCLSHIPDWSSKWWKAWGVRDKSLATKQPNSALWNYVPIEFLVKSVHPGHWQWHRQYFDYHQIIGHAVMVSSQWCLSLFYKVYAL